MYLHGHSFVSSGGFPRSSFLGELERWERKGPVLELSRAAGKDDRGTIDARFGFFVELNVFHFLAVDQLSPYYRSLPLRCVD